ncbi:hypothetical protein SAMN04490179_4522 [Pseudomonas antarctica]|uniref:Uncharacterized protein n=1 Tax=Pseudomonas antarctica TaxID=219572 RepID=A0A1H0BWN4_9PSED|nr:hypothetical protein [Pseudomonas antarctica]KAF2406685.1 hypothetical protein PSAN_48620 [Pseudomonas antarctica]SDN49993.1 hypothetical protein SAMN04490179_4522 [Pseudomonas antarctica]
MKLIPEWKRCYRLYSVQLGVLIAFFGFSQVTLLPMWQAQLSPDAYATANSLLALLLFVVRLVKQGPDQWFA